MDRSTWIALLLLTSSFGGCAPDATVPEPELALEALYQSFEASFEAPDDELEATWRSVVEHGWSESHPELDAFLRRNAASLALLRERIGAADALAAAPGRGYSPKLLHGRHMTNLLLLEGRRLERARQPDEALDTYLAALRFAHRHLHEREAPLIVVMIGTALQTLAVAPIQDLVHRSGTSDVAWRRCIDELGALRRAWPDLTRVQELDDALLLERLRGDDAGMWSPGEPDRLFLEHFVTLQQEYGRLFADAYRAGDPERLELAIDAKQVALEGRGTQLGLVLSEEARARAAAERVCLEQARLLRSGIEVDMIRRLELDMLRVVIAALLYGNDHGRRPPDSLAELVPEYLDELPPDLFALSTSAGTHAPLRLARHGEHWWIYSVGPDRTDQGGLSEWDRAAGGDLLSVAEHRHPRD